MRQRRRRAVPRSGHSKNKPFCDGTHRSIEFTDASRA
ncbi:MAG: CDGSH iron-sulfur domain-containing protein [Bacilli bacterium]